MPFWSARRQFLENLSAQTSRIRAFEPCIGSRGAVRGGDIRDDEKTFHIVRGLPDITPDNGLINSWGKKWFAARVDNAFTFTFG